MPRPNFNPRAPCRARLGPLMDVSVVSLFQSTRPVQGATQKGRNSSMRKMKFQSTRPVQGATVGIKWDIDDVTFQSTRPVQGATHLRKPQQEQLSISIHAPRAGRDL